MCGKPLLSEDFMVDEFGFHIHEACYRKLMDPRTRESVLHLSVGFFDFRRNPLNSIEGLFCDALHIFGM